MPRYFLENDNSFIRRLLTEKGSNIFGILSALAQRRSMSSGKIETP
jgi:hypothetical protein